MCLRIWQYIIFTDNLPGLAQNYEHFTDSAVFTSSVGSLMNQPDCLGLMLNQGEPAWLRICAGICFQRLSDVLDKLIKRRGPPYFRRQCRFHNCLS